MNLIDRARLGHGQADAGGARANGTGTWTGAGQEHAATAEQYFAQPWHMLVLLLAVVSLGSMGRYAVGPLSPLILAHFSLSKAQSGLLSSAVGLGAIGTAYVAGVLVDRLGVRRMIRLGLLAIGAPLVLFFFPVNFVGATLLLLLTGVGFSTISPLATNGTVSWFPQPVRGLTVGLTQAGIPLGVALAGLVLPRLALVAGWSRALGALGLTVTGAGWLLYGLYRNGPLTLAGSRAKTVVPGQREPLGRGSRTAVLREGGIVWLYALGLVLGMAQNAVISFLVPFLLDRLSLTVVTAGTFLSVSQLAGMGMRPLVGFVSDRFAGGRRKGLLVGMALLGGAALVLLVLTPTTLPGGLLVLLVALVGMSTLGWPGLYLALNLEKARPGTSGAAAGAAVAAMMIGSLIGPTLFGYLVDNSTYNTGWLAMTALLWVTAGLFAVGFRERAT